MPTCWCMKLKGESAKAHPFDIDQALCDALGIDCSPDEYYLNWWNFIGMCGSFPKFREGAKDDKECIAVADFLEANYDLESWHEVSGFR